MKINTKFTPNALAASRESAEALVDMLGIKGDIQKLDICNLRPFKDHPFKPYSPIKLRELADDIAVNGVISPIIVRAQVDHYEILAGHNRVEASKMAGLTQIPAIVKNVDDETACLIMANTNINQREELLPSEKAFAYKMRAEAMKKTVGRPSKENVSQVGTQKRSDQVLAEQTGERDRKSVV